MVMGGKVLPVGRYDLDAIFRVSKGFSACKIIFEGLGLLI